MDTDEISKFLRLNELSETKINWLKSLGPKSETDILSLIGTIMQERATVLLRLEKISIAIISM
jgi:hypothetical protein